MSHALNMPVETGAFTPAARRLPGVDLARGLAVIAMVLYHLTWDLGYFHLIDSDLAGSPLGRLSAHAIAMSFLALVGISLILAKNNSNSGGANFMRKFWRRLALIGASAAAISLVTYLAMPDEWIFFGILHCIFVSSLIGLVLIDAPIIALIGLSVVVLLLPYAVSGGIFDMPALIWLGLGAHLPRTNDFAPLFPSLTAVLAGMVLAKILLLPPEFANDNEAPTRPNILARALHWCGRHSLPIYLAHQPVLFGLFMGLTSLTGATSDEARFEADCHIQCAASGGKSAICIPACSCVTQQLKANGLWTPMLRGQLDQEGQARMTDYALMCGQKAQEVAPALN